MRRLYFMLPDVSTARMIVNELLINHIDEHHIHVLAKPGIDIGDLPEASLLQKSDFIPAVERGIAIGGITGMIASIAVVSFSPEQLALGGGTILISSLFGAIMGAWASSMIGIDVRNTQIKRFEPQIDKGEILLMVDVPKARTETINEMVHRLNPKAELGGTEPQIPAFP